MSKYGLSLTTVPKDLYYVERKLVADQAAEIVRLRKIFADLRKVWFSGADLDKDAISQATLRAIIEAETSATQQFPCDATQQEKP